MTLAEHFLSTYLKGRGLGIEGFSAEAKNMLINYDFPGNARELRNIVERAAILAKPGFIEPRHLNLPKTNQDENHLLSQTDEEKERQKILSALEAAKWNRRQAAKNLGIPYSSLRYKLNKLGIS